MRNLIVLVMLSVALVATAEARPKRLSGESFDTILDSVDTATAADLAARRASIDEMRAELQALRETGADDDSIASTRAALREARGSLNDELRAIVRSDEDLQAALRSAAHAAREEHRAAREANHDARFDELLSVATAEQATLLQSQQAQIEQLRSDLHAASDAGASNEVRADLKADLRTLRRDQRAAIREVVEANREVLDDVVGPGERRRFRRGRFGG